MEWLLEFAQHDLAARPSEGTQERLRDLALRVRGGVEFDLLRLVKIRSSRLVRRSRGSFRGFLSWTVTDTRQLHRQLRHVLERLLPTETADGSGEVMVPSRVRSVWLRHDGRRIVRTYEVRARDLLWFSIAALIEEFGGQLRRCQASDCRAIFLRRRRQTYHARACSQRVRQAKWYRRHQKAVRAARRARYRNDIRAQHPNAKIPERRRTRAE
jgi:hypothetical protein